jgi:hypothetical protein
MKRYAGRFGSIVHAAALNSIGTPRPADCSPISAHLCHQRYTGKMSLSFRFACSYSGWPSQSRVYGRVTVFLRNALIRPNLK